MLGGVLIWPLEMLCATIHSCLYIHSSSLNTCDVYVQDHEPKTQLEENLMLDMTNFNAT